MTKLGKIALKVQIDADIRRNGNREITPEKHNAIETNITDSHLNLADGGMLVDLLAGYSSLVTISDQKAFTHKKYVDDAVGSITLGFASLTGDPYDNAALAAALDELIKLDGSTPWTGDQDVNGNDLIGISTILLDGDMTFDLAGDKIFFVDGSSDLFTIEKATAYGNGANITWKLNDSADNSQGALVFQKATVGTSGIFSGMSAGADLVLFSGMGYDPSMGDPLGRIYIGPDGHAFYGAFSIVGSAPSAPTVSHYFRGYNVGDIVTFSDLSSVPKFILSDNGDIVITPDAYIYSGAKNAAGSGRFRFVPGGGAGGSGASYTFEYYDTIIGGGSYQTIQNLT